LKDLSTIDEITKATDVIVVTCELGHRHIFATAVLDLYVLGAGPPPGDCVLRTIVKQWAAKLPEGD